MEKSYNRTVFIKIKEPSSKSTYILRSGNTYNVNEQKSCIKKIDNKLIYDKEFLLRKKNIVTLEIAPLFLASANCFLVSYAFCKILYGRKSFNASIYIVALVGVIMLLNMILLSVLIYKNDKNQDIVLSKIENYRVKENIPGAIILHVKDGKESFCVSCKDLLAFTSAMTAIGCFAFLLSVKEFNNFSIFSKSEMLFISISTLLMIGSVCMVFLTNSIISDNNKISSFYYIHLPERGNNNISCPTKDSTKEELKKPPTYEEAIKSDNVVFGTSVGVLR